MTYEEFLKTKELKTIEVGFDVERNEICPMAFDFQKDLIQWACKKGKAAILIGCGCGKGQPYGSKVLTTDGWINIEDLKVGQMAYASDGKPYRITGVYPKQPIETYRFHYSDHTSMVFDKDHLHICRTAHDRQRSKPWRVMSTTELLDSNIRYGSTGKSRNYDIPIVTPVEYPERDYYISPYIMGALIGDGCIKYSVSIMNPEKEIINRIQLELPDGVSLDETDRKDHWVIHTGLHGNVKHPFREELSRLGILSKLSHEKFIPEEYKRGSVRQRLELLRGLMDTDGYSGGSQNFYTTSEKLRDDVIELVQSLGGIPTWWAKKGKYKKDEEIVECKDCYNICFSLKTFNPFYLSRKAEQWNPNPRDNGRWIDRIEFEKIQRTVCISVDSPDHSYVTENYVVTHNTVIQLSWAELVHKHTNGDVLIVAPLSVVEQTRREAQKFGIMPVNVCRTQEDVKPGLNITNYEMVEHFNADAFIAVVLDESSILKSFTSKTTEDFTKRFARTPYKLLCTATIAPNSFTEIGTSCEFLGIMSRTEMLATYFVHDGGKTSEWRLKKAGKNKFWEWLATWAVYFDNPNELGYEMDGYDLPRLNMHTILTKSEVKDGELVVRAAETLQERREVRKESLRDRCGAAYDLIISSLKEWNENE